MGTGSALRRFAMRSYDEADPKKPRPVVVTKKGTNPRETAEAGPWHMTRHDTDTDRHRHVV